MTDTEADDVLVVRLPRVSSISLPSTVLLLIGGAIGDRLGARRVMITGTASCSPSRLSWPG